MAIGTFIDDLKVNDIVIERHIYSGLYYRSTVTAVTDDVVTLKRPNNEVVRYRKASGNIIVPYGEMPNFQLEQYQYTTEGTPYKPAAVPDDAEDFNFSDAFVPATD